MGGADWFVSYQSAIYCRYTRCMIAGYTMTIPKNIVAAVLRFGGAGAWGALRGPSKGC